MRMSGFLLGLVLLVSLCSCASPRIKLRDTEIVLENRDTQEALENALAVRRNYDTAFRNPTQEEYERFLLSLCIRDGSRLVITEKAAQRRLGSELEKLANAGSSTSGRIEWFPDRSEEGIKIVKVVPTGR